MGVFLWESWSRGKYTALVEATWWIWNGLVMKQKRKWKIQHPRKYNRSSFHNSQMSRKKLFKIIETRNAFADINFYYFSFCLRIFDQLESFHILNQFSGKPNFQTIISIPCHALQEPSSQLRAAGKAQWGISMCRSNKHVQQSIKIQGRLNYICTSFFQEFQPNPQQWEPPLGSTWVQISGLWDAPLSWYTTLESRHAAGEIREGQPGSCQPKRPSCTSLVQEKHLNQLEKSYFFFSHELRQKAFKGQIPLHTSKSFVLC